MKNHRRAFVPVLDKIRERREAQPPGRNMTGKADSPGEFLLMARPRA
jgi:hypothetical protein